MYGTEKHKPAALHTLRCLLTRKPFSMVVNEGMLIQPSFGFEMNCSTEQHKGELSIHKHVHTRTESIILAGTRTNAQTCRMTNPSVCQYVP